MKAAKNGSCCDGTEALDRSREWRIFVQCTTRRARATIFDWAQGSAYFSSARIREALEAQTLAHEWIARWDNVVREYAKEMLRRRAA